MIVFAGVVFGTGDDCSSPEMAKFESQFPAELLPASESPGGGLSDAGPGVTMAGVGRGGVPAPVELLAALAPPERFVIMALTDAGMERPVVWFMYVTTRRSSSSAFACIMM